MSSRFYVEQNSMEGKRDEIKMRLAKLGKGKIIEEIVRNMNMQNISNAHELMQKKLLYLALRQNYKFTRKVLARHLKHQFRTLYQ